MYYPVQLSEPSPRAGAESKGLGSTILLKTTEKHTFLVISFKYSLFVLIDFFAKTATPYHLLVDNLKKAIKTANSNIYFVFLEAGNTIKLPEKVMFHFFSHCPAVLSNLGQI